MWITAVGVWMLTAGSALAQDAAVPTAEEASPAEATPPTEPAAEPAPVAEPEPAAVEEAAVEEAAPEEAVAEEPIADPPGAMTAHGTDPESYDAIRDNTRTALSRRLPRRGFDQRTMRDHMFQDPQLFDDAMITSHLGLTGSLGGTHAARMTDSNGDEYTRLMAGFGVGIDLGFSFGNPDIFGIFTEIDGMFLAGVNDHTILEDGVEANGDIKAGVGLRLIRIDDAGTQISIKPKYAGTFSVGVRPNQGIQAVADQTDIGDAIRLFIAHQGGASLDYAQALGGHWASLQFSFEYLGGVAKVSLEDSTDGSRIDVIGGLHDFFVGVAPTLDLWPEVPFAFQVEYRLGYYNFRPKEETLDNVDWLEHAAGGSIYYTGHPDFQLGVGASGSYVGAGDNAIYAANLGLTFRGYL